MVIVEPPIFIWTPLIHQIFMIILEIMIDIWWNLKMLILARELEWDLILMLVMISEMGRLHKY